MQQMTRREMLHAAGGVTFLGLVPVGIGYAVEKAADGARAAEAVAMRQIDQWGQELDSIRVTMG